MTGIAMLFAGFSSAYIVLRGVPTWERIQFPPLVWGNALVLIASSLTLELSRHAVKSDKAAALRQWLVITGALGVGFVLGQIELWRQMTAAGAGLTATLHSSFFYVFSGVHAVHILGGLIGLAVVIVKTFKGRLSSANFEPLRVFAKYWHFMAGVWIYLLLLVFFA
jgi:cytochrome c oxidase subunit 3